MKRITIALSLIFIVSVFMHVGAKYSFASEMEKATYTNQFLNEQNNSKEKWGALDEVIIEKYAADKGKEPKPFIELEGDLLLFIFSLLSGIAGFIIGYYSRVIFSKKDN